MNTETAPPRPDPSEQTPTPPPAKTGSKQNPAPPAPKPSPKIVEDSSFPEVVYVFMRDAALGRWICTGTLVSKSTVITAAHCVDPTMFTSYQIVAPNAPGKPRVAATNPKVFGGPFDDVANPDVGMLTLEEPIDLPGYAELTDVVSRVEGGEKLVAAALVRTAEKPEAPLAWSADQPLSSTVELGYEHGFGTPLFTKGGDSGAGLFLVENGARTHKLIGVARQPEPERNLDHFTRVDAAFLQWFTANAK